MKKRFERFWSCDEGQDLIEYSLLMALIALVTVGVVHAKLTGIWSVHPKSARTMAS
jgi:Flp pilus assembly pilin Flp